MSVEVMTMVFKRYPNGGGEMLLALALADHSNDQGTGIYPSIASLADKTRQSVRAVQYQLRGMEKSGWLELVNSGNGGRNQRREYRISPAWIKGAEIAPPKVAAAVHAKGADIAPRPEDTKGAIYDTKGATSDTKGANGDTKGCKQLHPHITVIEPSESSRTVTGARKRSPGFDPMCLELPDWLDADLWGRWVRHRVQIRKPLTEEAAKQQIKDLAGFKQQGHTPEAVITHAIGKSWQGLFAPNGAAAGGAQRSGKFNPTAHVNRNRTRAQGGNDYDDGRTIDA